jgi:hypothetical protein
MNTSVVVAIVSAAASIIVAAASLVFNARQKRAEDLRQLKLSRYTELLTAISDLAVHGLNADTQARYSLACNVVALTAPTSVIKALYEYEDEINIHNNQRTLERQKVLFNQFVLEIRRSLDLPLQDDSAFEFRLMSGLQEDETSEVSPAPTSQEKS